MARPEKEIKQDTFESLCGLQCTKEEICDFVGCTPKTLTAWCRRTYGMQFSEAFEMLKGRGRVSLRRKQWNLADKNVTMAIWLGKQYLGQSEKAGVNPEQLPTATEGDCTVEDLFGE